MSNTASQISTTVQLAVAATNGQLLQLDTTGGVLAATAVFGVVQSALPLAVGAQAQVILSGVTQIRCIAGLTLAKGNALYLSATPGFATNIANGNTIGVVQSVGRYATTGLVTAVLALDTATVNPANWDSTLCRYWLVDYDGGSDANVGYIDAVPGATLVPTGIALKTLERLRQLMPTYGNGLRCAILIKPRAAFANYLKIDGVTQDDLDLRKYVNYQPLLVRGSSDLTNTTADRVSCGFLTAYAGPGAAGEFTVGVGSTTSNIVVGSALPAEDATGQSAISFFRVRFLTGALAGTCAWIYSNDTGNIVPGVNTASAPVNGDTFLIERPGVRVQSYFDSLFQRIAKGESVNNFFRSVTAGICVTNTANGTVQLAGAGADGTLCGFEGVSTTATMFNYPGTQLTEFTNTYRDESGTLRNLGMGMRWVGGGSLGPTTFQSFATAFVNTTTQFAIASGRYNIGTTAGPVYFGKFPLISAVNEGIGQVANSALLIPVNTIGRLLGISTFQRTRIYVGAITSRLSVSCRVSGVNFFGASVPVLSVQGTGLNISVEDVIGTGNTDYVMNLDLATDCVVSWGQVTANTITATLGDITSANSGIATFAQLAYTGWIDKRGNKLIGTGQLECSQGIAVTASGAVALGAVVRATASAIAAAAQADTQANATAVLGCAQNAAVDGANFMLVPSGIGLMAFAATPTVPPTVAFLSEATAGLARMTKPATAGNNQALRLGNVIRPIAGQPLAVAAIYPDFESVLA